MLGGGEHVFALEEVLDDAGHFFGLVPDHLGLEVNVAGKGIGLPIVGVKGGVGFDDALDRQFAALLDDKQFAGVHEGLELLEQLWRHFLFEVHAGKEQDLVLLGLARENMFIIEEVGGIPGADTGHPNPFAGDSWQYGLAGGQMVRGAGGIDRHLLVAAPRSQKQVAVGRRQPLGDIADGVPPVVRVRLGRRMRQREIGEAVSLLAQGENRLPDDVLAVDARAAKGVQLGGHHQVVPGPQDVGLHRGEHRPVAAAAVFVHHASGDFIRRVHTVRGAGWEDVAAVGAEEALHHKIAAAGHGPLGAAGAAHGEVGPEPVFEFGPGTEGLEVLEVALAGRQRRETVQGLKGPRTG